MFLTNLSLSSGRCIVFFFHQRPSWASQHFLVSYGQQESQAQPLGRLPVWLWGAIFLPVCVSSHLLYSLSLHPHCNNTSLFSTAWEKRVRIDLWFLYTYTQTHTHTFPHIPSLFWTHNCILIHYMVKSVWTHLQISGFGWFNHTCCWQVYTIKHTAM